MNALSRLAVVRAIWSPTRVIPSRIVKDIRDADFWALRKEGYAGVIFDKDNTLTLPYSPRLLPELGPAFQEAKEAFGSSRVLIVSNSSGTFSEDPGFIEAEGLERELGCSVLRHRFVKPSGNCVKEIKAYYDSLDQFDSVNTPTTQLERRLVVVGDRLLTDVLMASEMKAYSIWTTRLWKKDFESLFWRIVERSWLGIARSVFWWKSRGERRRKLELGNEGLKSDAALHEIHPRRLRRETNARIES
ncbi:HAD-superfamily phosphatase [Serendipita vermifera]|nr:HAD-superfamily phosphatase [Serendipita vermifera]